MGQCMSRKAEEAFTNHSRSSADCLSPFVVGSATRGNHKKKSIVIIKSKKTRRSQERHKMQRNHHNLSWSPGDENSPPAEHPKNNNKRHQYSPATTKGVASSFGFRQRRVAAPVSSNSTAARRLANNISSGDSAVDRNGNGRIENSTRATATTTSDDETEPLLLHQQQNNYHHQQQHIGSPVPHKLMPPKKEALATRVNRFGFRHPQINRHDKVADLNNGQYRQVVEATTVCHNNINNLLAKGDVKGDCNKVVRRIGQPFQTERYMFQASHVQRPEPVRLICASKTAKTLANNSRKIESSFDAAANAMKDTNNISSQSHYDDSSSKDGSLTEDSGLGIQGPSDLDRLNFYSPRVSSSGSSSNSNGRVFSGKGRNLEMVKGAVPHTFDVKDLDDDDDDGSIGGIVKLPQLPSAFSPASPSDNKGVYNTGFVRDLANDYQQRIAQDNRKDTRRAISATSSEGFCSSSSNSEDEKADVLKTENLTSPITPNFIKPEYRKGDLDLVNDYWDGGEALANNCRAKEIISNTTSPSKVLHTLMLIKKAAPDNVNNFEAIANSASLMLDDETSPVDSLISYTESDDNNKNCKVELSTPSSKEKMSPPDSPGTPTNASLSLSDPKDDEFLIDDEIADQPALCFESGNDLISQHLTNSEHTLVESTTTTPKAKRRTFKLDGSPLLALRKQHQQNKKIFHNSAGTLDTLSPCESIASDDLMMDFDYSQSSGVEDFDRNETHGFSSLDETVLIRKTDAENNSLPLKDWSGSVLGEKYKKGGTSRSRLLWSRGTESPRSLDGTLKSTTAALTNTKSRRSITSSGAASPMRLGSRAGGFVGGGGGCGSGYDSDDSIRLDRASHTAMKQDIMGVKTMLIKLKRVLNESETHIPFDHGRTINGLFNGSSDDQTVHNHNDLIVSDDENYNNSCGSSSRSTLELAELKRQILFLQGQLEDKERSVQVLQKQMIEMTTQNFISNSAPASSTTVTTSTCNAATQTERIRPISAGPALLNGSSPTTEGTPNGSLVSASENRRSRPQNNSSSSSSSSTPSIIASTPASATAATKKINPPIVTNLWRKPGEPPSPQLYTSGSPSAIPRRASSRTRTTVS